MITGNTPNQHFVFSPQHFITSSCNWLLTGLHKHENVNTRGSAPTGLLTPLLLPPLRASLLTRGLDLRETSYSPELHHIKHKNKNSEVRLHQDCLIPFLMISLWRFGSLRTTYSSTTKICHRNPNKALVKHLSISGPGLGHNI